MKKSVNRLVLLMCVVTCVGINSVVGQTYKIVDGIQVKCFNTTGVMECPSSGQALYGQDAHYTGNAPSYTLSNDGKTVYDNNTGLTWMRSPNMTNTPPVKTDRMSYAAAVKWVATVNAAKYGGFNDWRLPNIKETYSLYLSIGHDPGSTTSSTDIPYIDTTYFKFAYGNTAIGERVIDQQYISKTLFILDPSESGSTKCFSVNFSDGRIKGYDTIDSKSNSVKTFYVQLVRGNLQYGINNFVDNNNQTITDQATGLMWSKNDNASALNWTDALAWVQTKNAENYLGYNDWRMPDIKELQSIVDYSHSPDFDGLPAINTTFFNCSSILNEGGQSDFPYYWSGSTHEGFSSTTGGGDADYVAFGRALGWPATQTKWIDVHGAGAQRCDPKKDPPFSYATVKSVTVGNTTYTGYSFGPQGDAIRGKNYLRLVRNVGVSTGLKDSDKQEKEVRIYPNPFTDKIQLSNIIGNEYYVLNNAMGQHVWSGAKIELQDFSRLERGVYILQIQTQSTIETIRLVKN